MSDLRRTGAVVARRTRGRVAAAQPRRRGPAAYLEEGTPLRAVRAGRPAARAFWQLGDSAVPDARVIRGPAGRRLSVGMFGWCREAARDDVPAGASRRRAGGRCPELDDHQRAVVDHPGGPLLVLAGPGTGKTTTLVEAIVDRIEHRGASPESVLALTFSRKAAEQLRDRVTARLGRTTSTTLCSTFHSFAYGLIRRYSPPELYAGPLRLLSAPEQDVVLRELLADAPESVRGRRRCAGPRRPAGSPTRCRRCSAGRGRRGSTPTASTRSGTEHEPARAVAAGWFLEQYLADPRRPGRHRLRRPDPPRGRSRRSRPPAPSCGAQFRHVFVDEYQDTDPGQVRLLQALAGDGARPDRRRRPAPVDLRASAAPRCAASSTSPTQFPHARRAGRPTSWRCAVTRRFGPRLLPASQRVAVRGSR